MEHEWNTNGTRMERKQQKQFENETALTLLKNHLAEVDAVADWRERLEAAATNLLAGNVFDWGAKEAAALMQTPGFGLQQARDHLQSQSSRVSSNELV